jgi:hypothetical protein
MNLGAISVRDEHGNPLVDYHCIFKIDGKILLAITCTCH